MQDACTSKHVTCYACAGSRSAAHLHAWRVGNYFGLKDHITRTQLALISCCRFMCFVGFVKRHEYIREIEKERVSKDAESSRYMRTLAHTVAILVIQLREWAHWDFLPEPARHRKSEEGDVFKSISSEPIPTAILKKTKGSEVSLFCIGVFLLRLYAWGVLGPVCRIHPLDSICDAPLSCKKKHIHTQALVRKHSQDRECRMHAQASTSRVMHAPVHGALRTYTRGGLGITLD